MLFISLIILYHMRKSSLVYEESNNGTIYQVVNDNKKKESANLLSDIIIRMYKLRNYLYINRTQYPKYEEYINLLYKNLDEKRTQIFENDARDTNVTSYSINKGEEIGFCLKSKKTQELHDINLLMYVAIHEMAHIASPSIGHDDTFKHIFRFLIDVSIDIGIYKYDDYNTSPVEYCGMILSSNIIN